MDRLAGVVASALDHAVVVAHDMQHRMHEEVRVHGVALQHDAYGVDQERTVVGDDQHHRPVGLPSVAVGVG